MTGRTARAARERHALLIGAMKAGTTALYTALAAHPEVAPGPTKEPGFWIRDDLRAQGLAGHRALWGVAPGDRRWRLDGSTAYTKLPVRPSAAPFLPADEAELRLVYLVRDPVARLKSQYVHSLAEGWISKPIHAELDLRAAWFSNYHLQLRPYVDFLGREAILVMSFEELVSDPRGGLRRVAEFLEIDPAGLPPGLPRSNDSDRYRSVRVQRALAAAGLAPPARAAAPSPRLSSRAAVEEGRARAAALGREGEVDAILAELAREVTPTAAHVERLHALLDDDLRRFEDAWGLDAWTGRRLAEPLRA